MQFLGLLLNEFTVESMQAELEKLKARMREEWDRRVAHDYRYWMSDGVESDSSMWESGARDFEFLIQDLDRAELKSKVSLEIGCGVGRLVRQAGRYFKQAIGVDVSREAIAKGRSLLLDVQNTELILGNGSDLSQLPDASIDFAYTFAALSSMPQKVIAQYLEELGRVVCPNGIIRLQVYLGKEQSVSSEDTLAIRAFSPERFRAALFSAGFEVEWNRELQLPFEVSDVENGLIAEIVSAVRSTRASDGSEAILEVLTTEREPTEGESWRGSQTEYLMALARARQHLDAGRSQEAQVALEFALKNYADAEDEIKALLRELRGVGAEQKKESPQLVTLGARGALGELFNPELYQRNLRVLNDYFPAVARQLESLSIRPEISAQRSTLGESILCWKGIPLSNKEKARRAAEVWAERTRSGLQSQAVHLVMLGIGDGYHLEALQGKSEAQRISVIETEPTILKALLGIRDCEPLLSRLDSISLSVAEYRKSREEANCEDPSELVILPQALLVAAESVQEMRRTFRSGKALKKLRPNIAVVGPMYGGSLPIAKYTANALQGMEQRVLSYDLSTFYKSFLHIESFLKKKERRNTVENHYVEMLSQLVLEAVTEKPIDILLCLAQAPLSARVLAECRARGIITVQWFVEDCRRFMTWQQISKYYDYMFVIQKGDVPKLVEQAGAGRAIYLPVGCDPNIHRPMQLSEAERAHFGSELSFVGAGYNNRRHVFSKFAGRDFKIWGTEWPNCLPFSKIVQNEAARVSVDDYVKVFNASTININLHSSQERDGVEPNGDFVNPRTFELAATGAFQLVDTRTLLGEQFDLESEIATFNDEKDLTDKINFYLQHPEERNKVIEQSRRRALAEHTYQHRLTTMLEYIYADHGEMLESKVEKGPWPKTLQAAKPYEELSQRLTAVFEKGEEPTLDSLVNDIQAGKGQLSDTEQKLLFLHHIRSQITNVQKLRNEDSK